MARAQLPHDIRISSRNDTYGALLPIRLGDGKDIRFGISVWVESRRQASDVVVTAELPEGVTLSSINTDKGTCGIANNLITCNMGIVGAEGQQAFDWSGAITVLVRPTRDGTITLTSRITASEPDPNPSNNTATATATVNPPKSRKRVRFF